MLDECVIKVISWSIYGMEFTNFLKQANAIDMDFDNVLSEDQIEIFFE